jgi:hypothetical protein
MPSDTSARLPYAVTIIGGVTLWTLTAAIGGRTEPWDTPGYWIVAYPLSIALAAMLGYVFPVRAWRWGLVLTLMQGVVMILGGSGLNLLPIGLALLGILSLPAVAAASLAAKVSLRNLSS